jgi:hypothetical protein
VLLTAEPAGVNCLDPGTRLDVGIDNGDGGGTPADGTLQPGEIDQTAYLCRPTPHFVNGDFELGNFTGWLTQDLTNPYNALVVTGGSPLQGSFDVLTGFDGNGGPGNDEIFVAQDLDLTGLTQASVTFDWSVPSCSLTFGATVDRTFSLVVEPAGGGAPLLTHLLHTCIAGVDTPHAPVIDEVVDISAVADQPIRVKFRWNVPENFVGPAESHLDDVRLAIAP